ncbi:hypothetical protein D3C75_1348720 [compost metagenome]
MVPVTEFTGQEKIAMMQARSSDTQAHTFFICIHLGRIEMPVSSFGCSQHALGRNFMAL